MQVLLELLLFTCYCLGFFRLLVLFVLAMVGWWLGRAANVGGSQTIYFPDQPTSPRI